MTTPPPATSADTTPPDAAPAATTPAQSAATVVQRVPGDPDVVQRLLGDPGQRRELARRNETGELDAADVHVALTLGRLGGEDDEAVLLAVAETVAAARAGSSCRELDDPAVLAAVGDSPLVTVGEHQHAGPAGRPLRLVGDVMYLERYWRLERAVAQGVSRRFGQAGTVDEAKLRASIQRLFPGPAPDRQRVAAALAVLGWFTVIAGGPGTGKTTTVARVIAALAEQGDEPPRIGLAAPTGKAAARLQEAIAGQVADLGLTLPAVRASTIHRLLGYRPGSLPRFRVDNPLPHDVVIVDETSMVSLPLLAKLLAAVRDDARLILLGDPDQLASVEVGAVLADLVERPTSVGTMGERLAAVVVDDVATDPAADQLLTDASKGVIRLTRGFRFRAEIDRLATAIRLGDTDQALDLLDRGSAVRLLSPVPDDSGRGAGEGEDYPELRALVVNQAAAVAAAADQGDGRAALAALAEHQVLTAHRYGPYGAHRWSALARRWATQDLDGYGAAFEGDLEWYLGRPIVVTRNDDDTGLANGDSGVAIRSGDGLLVTFDQGDRLVTFHPGRLPDHLPLQAITVHRAQGSQYRQLSVILPEPTSAVLSRELLYTAVTRAQKSVTIYGSPESVRTAIQRPARRASGLRLARSWTVTNDPVVSTPTP